MSFRPRWLSSRAAAASLAHQVVSHGLRFAGLQAYHGRAQHLRTPAERESAIRHAVSLARAAQASVTSAGIACPLVTGAGTGTFVHEAASGLYGELQAGSYVFMDRDYADNHAAPHAPLFEHALFVKSQVMSAGTSHVVVDAGHKSHAIDSGLPRVHGRELEFVNGGDGMQVQVDPRDSSVTYTGFQFGWNIHTLAWVLMILVILSGLYGISVYAILPQGLSDSRSEMTGPQMIDGLGGEGGVVEHADEDFDSGQRVALRGERFGQRQWFARHLARHQPVTGPPDGLNARAVLERLDQAGLQQLGQPVGPLHIRQIGDAALARADHDAIGIKRLKRLRFGHHEQPASTPGGNAVLRRGEVESRGRRARRACGERQQQSRSLRHTQTPPPMPEIAVQPDNH